ncbi:MAG: hypothetical protein D6732_18220 [Methanobacteriota archaeon]|nr:MAG: hypothetical protein D6732_18220 [Euryarchaeota archaeon]
MIGYGRRIRSHFLYSDRGSESNKKIGTVWVPIAGLIAFTLLLSGCEKHFDSLDEFEHYIKGEDSPYVQSVVRNGVRITVRYLPAEALMIPAYRRFLREKKVLLADTSLNEDQRIQWLDQEKAKLEQQKRMYERGIYFSLTIGFVDPSKDIVYHRMQRSFSEYSQWIRKLMFQLHEYIYLRTPAIDEIPLNTYHMERTFGLRKDRTFLLLFPDEFNGQKLISGSNRQLALVLREFGLGVGRLKFEFNVPVSPIHFQI